MGVGGVGGYYGARLAAAGREVVFVTRGAALAALRRDGLRVDSVRGDVWVRDVVATDDPSGEAPVDAVLLAVKTWQVAEACEAARPRLGPGTVVVPLQNGVDAPSLAARVVGGGRVLPGTVKVFAETVGPGHVQHGSGPGTVTVGEWAGGPSARLARLGQALDVPGVESEPVDDVWAALWTKFLFVAPLGAVGAVTRAPVGVLRSEPETRALLVRAMREAEAVGRARGVALAPDVVDRMLAFLDAHDPSSTTSLHRDVVAGRPSELEAWPGAVVRLGREVGVPTPVNGALYDVLLPLERRARGQLTFET